MQRKMTSYYVRITCLDNLKYEDALCSLRKHITIHEYLLLDTRPVTIYIAGSDSLPSEYGDIQLYSTYDIWLMYVHEALHSHTTYESKTNIFALLYDDCELNGPQKSVLEFLKSEAEPLSLEGIGFLSAPPKHIIWLNLSSIKENLTFLHYLIEVCSCYTIDSYASKHVWKKAYCDAGFNASTLFVWNLRSKSDLTSNLIPFLLSSYCNLIIVVSLDASDHYSKLLQWKTFTL